MKRILLFLFMSVTGLLFALTPIGCGEQDPPQPAGNASATAPRTVVEEDSFRAMIDELERKAFTLKITGSGSWMPMFAFPMTGAVPDGGDQGSYSQDGKGSWRYDHPSGATIFNAAEKKTWFIEGKTAWETTYSSQEFPGAPFSAPSPLSMVLFSVPPRVGPDAVAPTIAGIDGVWEWDMYGSSSSSTFGAGFLGTAVGQAGSTTSAGPPASTVVPEIPPVTLRIEFKGPEGLLSRVVVTEPSGAHEQLFEYSNVGDVPDDMFRLPADIEEVRIFSPQDGPMPFPGPVPYM